MNDDLGDRMKGYEDITRIYLPRRTNMMIRCDGKCFSSLTKNSEKPFDNAFMSHMDNTALGLCEKIQGVKLGYVQSDEITLWLTDYDTNNTDQWFGGNLQKIVSVSGLSSYFTF